VFYYFTEKANNLLIFDMVDRIIKVVKGKFVDFGQGRKLKNFNATIGNLKCWKDNLQERKV